MLLFLETVTDNSWWFPNILFLTLTLSQCPTGPTARMCGELANVNTVHVLLTFISKETIDYCTLEANDHEKGQGNVNKGCHYLPWYR